MYLAYDTTLHRQVGLKVLTDSGPGTSRQSLLREARNAAALNHPNICTVYEVAEADGVSFIAMEYVKGRPLGDLIRAGPLSLGDVLRYGAQAADALAYAHGRGVIHRDFKAANIILGEDGRLRVVDFGLARREQAELADAATMATVAPAGSVAGTPYAMAPEQVRGAPSDLRTDIWALGVLLYEMASGTTPFRATSTADLFSAILRDAPQPLPDTVPAALAAAIARCLEKLPERRYQAATEVAAALECVRANTSRLNGGARRTLLRPRQLAAGVAAVGLAAFAIALGPAALLRVAPDTSVESGGDAKAQAYDLYLRALSHAHRRSQADLEQSISLLEQAAVLDPAFLPVQAQLALTYSTMSTDYAPTDPVWEEKAYAATQKALEVDPKAAEAHYARSLLLWRPSQGFLAREALNELRQAVTAKPGFEDAWHQLGVIQTHVGHHEAARRSIARALELNPGHSVARFRLAPIHSYEQQFEDAIAVLNRVPKEVYPAQRTYHMAWALISLNRLAEAGRLLDEALRDNPTDPGGVMHAARAMLRATRGDRAGAEADAAQAASAGRGFIHFHHTAYSLGAVNVVLGNLDSAEDWVSRAANDGFPNYRFFEVDRHLAPLRARPGFRAFIAKLRQEWAHIPGEPD